MESFLLYETNFVSWKIGSRFFAELAEALDYLHNFNPPCVRGDLKPQNILLTDRLQFKLADFGASKFATLSGATTVPNAVGNTQHTPFYSGPEYLKEPSVKRYPSMDVYSYAMIGYEIVTRKQMFGESGVPPKTIIS